jgi:hypothetical protein
VTHIHEFPISSFQNYTYKGSRFKIDLSCMLCSIVSDLHSPQRCPTHLPNPGDWYQSFHWWLLPHTSTDRLRKSSTSVVRDQHSPVADHRTQQLTLLEGRDSQALNISCHTSGLEPRTALTCHKIHHQFNAPVVTFSLYSTRYPDSGRDPRSSCRYIAGRAMPNRLKLNENTATNEATNKPLAIE